MRLVALLVIALFLAAALVASNRERPLVAEPHGSGAWQFNNAALEPPPEPGPDEVQIYELCPFDPPTNREEVHQA